MALHNLSLERARDKRIEARRAAALDETTEALPQHPAPSATNLTGDSTAANLAATLDILSQTVRAQASQQAGSSMLDPRLIRAVKDLATAWGGLHAEMRSSIQAMSDTDFLRTLAQISTPGRNMLTPPPPLPEADAPHLYTHTNFPPTETSIPPLPTPSRSSLGPRPAIINFNELEESQKAPKDAIK